MTVLCRLPPRPVDLIPSLAQGLIRQWRSEAKPVPPCFITSHPLSSIDRCASLLPSSVVQFGAWTPSSASSSSRACTARRCTLVTRLAGPTRWELRSASSLDSLALYREARHDMARQPRVSLAVKDVRNAVFVVDPWWWWWWGFVAVCGRGVAVVVFLVFRRCRVVHQRFWACFTSSFVCEAISCGRMK